METDIEAVMREQSKKLPSEVVDFISSLLWRKSLEEIDDQYQLPEDLSAAYAQEVLLVLLGLTHPDEFPEVLAEHLGSDPETTATLARETDARIFASIRPALIDFFEKEQLTEEPQEESAQATSKEAAPEIPLKKPIVPVRTWEKVPEVIPENLPTEEAAESFLPNLAPKIAPEVPKAAPEEIHPFEEKMRRVFTGTATKGSDLSLETPLPQPSTPAIPVPPTTPPQTRPFDPYREPIE